MIKAILTTMVLIAGLTMYNAVNNMVTKVEASKTNLLNIAYDMQYN